MSRIPITKDFAEVVGKDCKNIENRSLLMDKFVFPKKWLNNPINQKASKQTLDNVFSKPIMLKDLQKESTENFLKTLQKQYGESYLRLFYGRLEGRLAINLSDSLLENAGICLNRLFGTPYIPGSAIKGICRAYAFEKLKIQKTASALEIFLRIFGFGKNEFKEKDGELREFRDLLPDCNFLKNENGKLVVEELKGAISFLPAHSVNNAKIIVDITNVHTPDYYRTGRITDLRKETPIPNYFPAVEAAAEFCFPLLLNSMSSDQNLLDVAEKWLATALTEFGIGAKTAAGYGWFSDISKERHHEIEQKQLEQEEKIKAHEEVLATEIDEMELRRLSGLQESELRSLINSFNADEKHWDQPLKTQRAILEVPKVIEIWEQSKQSKRSKAARSLKKLADKFNVELP